MKVGDLVVYRPPMGTFRNPDGRTVVGIVIAGTGAGDITKLIATCGARYWAVTKHCEVVSESR